MGLGLQIQPQLVREYESQGVNMQIIRLAFVLMLLPTSAKSSQHPAPIGPPSLKCFVSQAFDWRFELLGH